MGLIRAIWEWKKYERLHHYPQLKAFDRDEALTRLKAYEAEELAASAFALWAWKMIAFGSVFVALIAFYVLGQGVVPVTIFLLLTNAVTLSSQYWLHCRISRRVEEKVRAELGDGRLWTCIECGYDLRASAERCPECGAAVRVSAPQSTQRDG